MEKTFLCFESDASLFLVPINLVYHIAPGTVRTGDIVTDGDSEIPVIDVCRLWGGDKTDKGEYIVLLQEDEDLLGLSVRGVLGVFQTDPVDAVDIPDEAKGKHNRFIKEAVYLQLIDRWAFVLGEGIISEIKEL